MSIHYSLKSDVSKFSCNSYYSCMKSWWLIPISISDRYLHPDLIWLYRLGRMKSLERKWMNTRLSPYSFWEVIKEPCHQDRHLTSSSEGRWAAYKHCSLLAMAKRGEYMKQTSQFCTWTSWFSVVCSINWATCPLVFKIIKNYYLTRMTYHNSHSHSCHNIGESFHNEKLSDQWNTVMQQVSSFQKKCTRAHI